MRTKVFNCIAGVLVLSISMITVPESGYSQENGGYISSNPKGCNLCHKPEATLWLGHGHSSMLRAVEGGKAPEGTKVQLPEGMSWSDISYLIGGSKNYANFADSKGYVVTGDKAIYSFEAKGFTPFEPDKTPGTRSYDCVKCHVVGWTATGSYEKGVNNELEGIPGKWFESSVGCEACHGPGHEHSAMGPKTMQDMKKKDKKADLKIIMSKKSEICGQCHKINDDNKVTVVAADLIRNEQQYSEMSYNKHAKLKVTCVACHNPHASSKTEEGLTRKCLDCHKGKFEKPVKIAAMQDLSCEDCHMPYAVRGGYDTMVKGYHKGDTRSHVFGITPDPDYKLDDGSGHMTLNSDGFARLTVEMTCYACHKSGEASNMSRAELLGKMKEVHGVQ
ncbi:MAG: hypothetical protein JXB48_05655 [Candidatus Latescibacteria bacterium]|nr:hypothetical protein [Candidatus Latescibacterota bacterium]